MRFSDHIDFKFTKYIPRVYLPRYIRLQIHILFRTFKDVMECRMIAHHLFKHAFRRYRSMQHIYSYMDMGNIHLT